MRKPAPGAAGRTEPGARQHGAPPTERADGAPICEEAQASSVSSRRLRVRFTSTGMPGPMVVDTVIFVM